MFRYAEEDGVFNNKLGKKTCCDKIKNILKNLQRNKKINVFCQLDNWGEDKQLSTETWRHRSPLSPHCLLVEVVLSSGAELSHCEQRGNQSLFTDQLSSASGWREETKRRRGRDGRVSRTLPSSSLSLLAPQTLLYEPVGNHVVFGLNFPWVRGCVCVWKEIWLPWQPAGSGMCGNPWQCDFYHKSQISTPGTLTGQTWKSKMSDSFPQTVPTWSIPASACR